MAKKKPAREKWAKKELPGLRLEKAVARVQQMMDKDSVVTHDEKLSDRLGNVRQYDVVIRGTFGGKPMLGIVEVRDHNRRKGPSDVEAFAKKTEHLGANLRMMVSKMGFTPQALVVAKHEFISCLSLLPNDANQGLMVGQFWYGMIRRWTDVRLVLRFSPPNPILGEWSYENLLWQKKKIVNWFLNELFNTHSCDREPGSYYLSLRFPGGTTIELNGIEYTVTELACVGTLVEKKKRKWVSWTGDAYFDWETNAIQVPGGSPLISTAVETDMTVWDDYGGELPTKATGKQLLLLAFGGQVLPKGTEIPDLMSLGPTRSIAPLDGGHA
ncbi:MAG: hypothetical protein L0Y58_25355 [Verrucomicrobia subdivision 3 bacterium]|nr:hypothetical protein [Gemmataceae bacterium]MCI0748749.1 hypothetical protein [Limisphaerales bacterium]